MTVMGWSNIGVITPNINWQLYPITTVGSESFRITSHWNIKPYYKLSAYLGQFFVVGSTVEVLTKPGKIYPIKDTKQVIELIIPKDYKDDGIITRDIGIKLSYPRLGVYTHDWQVEIDEYL